MPLAVALAVNVAAYALVVRPLGAQVGRRRGSRGRRGGRALRPPNASWRWPRRWSRARRSADEELSAFYEKVLPADLGRRAAA